MLGGLIGAGVGATGAKVGTTGADVGTTGADVGTTGADVGTTGADVGTTGADVGTTGANVGATGALVGATGADVGATGAAVPSSTRAGSQDDTFRPEKVPLPVTQASTGPSGACDGMQVGPTMYLSSPGQSVSGGIVTGFGPRVPPQKAGSVNITSNKHSPLEGGTVIW